MKRERETRKVVFTRARFTQVNFVLPTHEKSLRRFLVVSANYTSNNLSLLVRRILVLVYFYKLMPQKSDVKGNNFWYEVVSSELFLLLFSDVLTLKWRIMGTSGA